MAFTVTPTSGAAPYTFEATFFNKMRINTGRYTLFLRSTDMVGSCPPMGNSTNLAAGASQLLANGILISNANVSNGSCRTFTLSITDNVDSSVISSATISISNV